ncbi:Uncharacterised protein [Achromobacter xylosoxidans]|nr:Uncharacterised protein [Achromobacter xylosoxidans]SQG78078.1 Uncharacterised protein [Achromobacter xylosoxidans]
MAGTITIIIEGIGHGRRRPTGSPVARPIGRASIRPLKSGKAPQNSDIARYLTAYSRDLGGYAPGLARGLPPAPDCAVILRPAANGGPRSLWQ